MTWLPLLAASILSSGGPAIAVRDIDGRRWTVPLEGKPTCLLFVASDCPIANRLAPELRRIVNDNPSVAFFFVYPDAKGSKATIAKHRKAFELNAPCLADAKFEIARFGRARVTPEAVLFDKSRERVYRGRINDLFTEHNVTLDKPTRNDLREAIRAVLAGEPVAEPQFAGVGCPIPFPKARA